MLFRSDYLRRFNLLAPQGVDGAGEGEAKDGEPKSEKKEEKPDQEKK